MLFNKVVLPPYKVLTATISSPDFAIFKKVLDIAAIPEPNAIASMPPSSDANLLSSTVLVGFENLT